ncbi:hypothetical protein A8A54_11040 [Brucella pseudogrignonensis]|uniref:hypothetical protein n=1 Tax=Brucella pseudogrignonensis TaxID=419475 RepID=UPI0007DA6223|nr:hypothetical protein A8A54_11040 [Brucella pseudogrignonensis]
MNEFEPVSCGGNVNHADETIGELVVSSGNGSIDFQSAKIRSIKLRYSIMLAITFIPYASI